LVNPSGLSTRQLVGFPEICKKLLNDLFAKKILPMKRYYYSKDGTTVSGPVNIAELIRLVDSHEIPETAQVCEEGQETWETLDSVVATHERPQVSDSNVGRSSGTSSAVAGTKAERKASPLIAVICISCLSLAVIGGLITWAMLTSGAAAKSAPIQGKKTTQPTLEPTSTPTPKVSAQTKEKIVLMIQAVSKLTSQIEQGVSLSDYKNQLAEIRSVLEALEIVGWPKNSEAAQSRVQFALNGWILAQDIWSEQARLQSNPEDALFFKTGGAEKIFGGRIRTQEANLKKVLDLDPELFSPADTFQLQSAFIVAWTNPGLTKDASKETLNPEEAVQACFKTSSPIFNCAKDNFKKILAEDSH